MMKYDLGFLGGGQLARMSIQAAQRMGLRCVSLDPGERTPASKIASAMVGSLHDPKAIAQILDSAEFVTLENEFIPASAIAEAFAITRRDVKCLTPTMDSLATVQDKLVQRQAFFAADVPSPNAVAIEGDGLAAREEIGFPLVLKSRFGGYDGKGTRYAHNLHEWESHRWEWERGGWLAEQFVPFHRELAVMVAIGANGVGEACNFPTVETVQTHSVCDLVYPASCDAAEIAVAAVKAVGGTGLFGVELFELSEGHYLVNELAPRPHNTGHYTLDWGGPSQFEIHVRAVMGLPLLPPSSSGFAVMANLLGQPGVGEYAPALRAALEEPRACVHWYEKDEAKPGRKMGHINVSGTNLAELPAAIEAVKRSRANFYRAWSGS